MSETKPQTPPGSGPSSRRPPPGDWIRLGEIEFHELIREKLAATGAIGDVFPMMVAHNVPHYVLARLWPEKYETFLADPAWLAFTVAETGWKGSIDNIKSRLMDTPDGGVQAEFAKSYVVSCDGMLMLLRRGDGFALALVPGASGDKNQTWTSRGEASVRMGDSQGGEIDHYFVEGRAPIASGDYLELSRKAYARLGLQIPRRELTSLALLAEPLLQYHGHDANADMRANAELIMNARKGEKIAREALDAAAKIMDAFFVRCEEANIELHPFWENAKKMRAFLVK